MEPGLLDQVRELLAKDPELTRGALDSSFTPAPTAPGSGIQVTRTAISYPMPNPPPQPTVPPTGPTLTTTPQDRAPTAPSTARPAARSSTMATIPECSQWTADAQGGGLVAEGWRQADIDPRTAPALPTEGRLVPKPPALPKTTGATTPTLPRAPQSAPSTDPSPSSTVEAPGPKTSKRANPPSAIPVPTRRYLTRSTCVIGTPTSLPPTRPRAPKLPAGTVVPTRLVPPPPGVAAKTQLPRPRPPAPVAPARAAPPLLGVAPHSRLPRLLPPTFVAPAVAAPPLLGVAPRPQLPRQPPTTPVRPPGLAPPLLGVASSTQSPRLRPPTPVVQTRLIPPLMGAIQNPGQPRQTPPRPVAHTQVVATPPGPPTATGTPSGLTASTGRPKVTPPQLPSVPALPRAPTKTPTTPHPTPSLRDTTARRLVYPPGTSTGECEAAKAPATVPKTKTNPKSLLLHRRIPKPPNARAAAPQSAPGPSRVSARTLHNRLANAKPESYNLSKIIKSKTRASPAPTSSPASAVPPAMRRCIVSLPRLALTRVIAEKGRGRAAPSPATTPARGAQGPAVVPGSSASTPGVSRSGRALKAPSWFSLNRLEQLPKPTRNRKDVLTFRDGPLPVAMPGQNPLAPQDVQAMPGEDVVVRFTTLEKIEKLMSKGSNRRFHGGIPELGCVRKIYDKHSHRHSLSLVIAARDHPIAIQHLDMALCNLLVLIDDTVKRVHVPLDMRILKSLDRMSVILAFEDAFWPTDVVVHIWNFTP